MKKTLLLALLGLCVVAVVFSGALLDAQAGWNEQGAWKGAARYKGTAIQVDEPSTAATVGDNKAGFTVPGWMDGWRLADADARVYTPGSGTGSLDIEIVKRTVASDATMYSLTVAAAAYGAERYTATPANERVAAGDIVSVGVTQINSTASQGLWVTLNFLP